MVFDVSMLKDTLIREPFRVESFHFPNRANSSVPASVGRIVPVDDPRQIQFGLKLLC